VKFFLTRKNYIFECAGPRLHRNFVTPLDWIRWKTRLFSCWLTTGRHFQGLCACAKISCYVATVASSLGPRPFLLGVDHNSFCGWSESCDFPVLPPCWSCQCPNYVATALPWIERRLPHVLAMPRTLELNNSLTTMTAETSPFHSKLT